MSGPDDSVEEEEYEYEEEDEEYYDDEEEDDEEEGPPSRVPFILGTSVLVVLGAAVAFWVAVTITRGPTSSAPPPPKPPPPPPPSVVSPPTTKMKPPEDPPEVVGVAEPTKGPNLDELLDKTLEPLQEMIRAGKINEAEMELLDRLRKKARNPGGWYLLAGIRRDRENWMGAVSAYRKVIDYDLGALAQHSRVEAAAIFQDKLEQPERALPLLKKYMDQKDEALILDGDEVMLRLGRAHIENNEPTEAKTVLEKLLASTQSKAHKERALELLSEVN